MAKYAFILGRKHLLSIAEICNVIDSTVFITDITAQALVADFVEPLLNPSISLQRLGGTIKIIEIFAEINNNMNQIFETIGDHLLKKFNGRSSKINYGVSLYSFAYQNEEILKNILKKTKKYLTEKGLKNRFINKNFQNPASAAILGEKLLLSGADIAIIKSNKQLFIGETVTLQDFESYSKRDYGRPARDPYIGMLPPKLAQIMINLGGNNKIMSQDSTNHPTGQAVERLSHHAQSAQPLVYDPFCGVGTILSEGLLLGYNVIGSDINPEVIQKAEQNIAWIRNQCPGINTKSRIFQKNAIALESKDIPEKIDFVVTESYLGPPLSKFPPQELLQKNFAYIRRTILDFFKAICPILKNGTVVVISLLAYKRANNLFFVGNLVENIIKLGFKEVPLIPKSIIDKFGLTNSQKTSLVYDRPDQIVAREIWKFVKK